MIIGGSVLTSDFITKDKNTSTGAEYEAEESQLTLSLGAGYIIPIEDNELTLGITSSILREDNTEEDKINGIIQPGKYDDSLSGNGIGLQAILKTGDSGRIGLSLKQNAVSGDEKIDNIKAGEIEEKETTIALKALYNLQGDVNAGFTYSQSIEDSIEKNLAKVKTMDDSNTSSDIGMGLSCSLPENKGLVGIDYHLLSGKEKDKLDSSNNVDIEGTMISLGGEYNVDEQLSFRAGYRIRSSKETGTGFPGVEATMNDITLGAGYKLDNLSFNLMLIISDGEDDSSDKEEASIRNIGLMVKYNF